MSATTPPSDTPPDEPPPDEPPQRELVFVDEPRRRKWPRRVGIAVLLLAVGVALLPSILSTGWTQDLIHAWLEKNVDRHVAFDDLELSWTDGIVLTNLSVADDRNPTRPVLKVPRVHVDAPILPLLTKRLLVRDFTFEDPVVNLTLRREGGTNAEGVFKRTKRKRKRDRKKRAGTRGPEPEPVVEEATALPEISVPVDVRNLTLVLRDPDGGETLQTGITFKGHLTTRGGPTTFDMRVPTGKGEGLRLHGTATLFDEGVPLAPADRQFDTKLEIDGLAAADHRELIGLFLPDLVVAGVLNGTVEAVQKGERVSGRLDLRLSDVAVGERAKDSEATGREDLSLTGAFEYGPDGFALEGFEARAEGLSASADMRGDWAQLEGAGTLDADLSRMADALAALGVTLPGEIGGKLVGRMEFPGAGARGKGHVALTEFHSAGWLEDRPPVDVDRANFTFEVVPEAESFRLEKAVLTLPDLIANAAGVRRADGSVSLDADVDGDLGGLLGRARDLGFLSGGFAVNGRVAGKIHVEKAAGADSVSVRTPGIKLTEDDAEIVVTGGRDTAGTLDVEARGSGDLGKLLARASESAAGIEGTFDLLVRATGTADAPVVEIEKLHLAGDVLVDASGSLAADGTLRGALTADGTMEGIETLLERIGVLDRPLGLVGRAGARATIAGTRDEPLIPDLRVQVTDGPITAKLIGSLGSGRSLQGVLDLKGPLDEIARLAHERGALEKPIEPGGTFSITAVAKGTLDAPEISTARISVNGPLTLLVDGQVDAQKRVRATFRADGALDSLARIQRDWNGTESGPLPAGQFSLRGDADADGDAVTARIGEIVVQSGAFRVEGNGSRAATGQIMGKVVGKGALGDALKLLAGFGQADTWRGDGSVEVRLECDVVDGVAAGTTSVRGDVTLVEKGEDGRTIREPALDLTVPSFRYHLEDERLEPTDVTFSADDGRAKARVAMEQRGEARAVSVTGDLALGNAFARRHKAHLGDVLFDRLAGTFDFDGELREGTEGAEGWKGSLDLTGERVVAPYVTAKTANVKATVAEGALALDQLTAAINGGTLDAVGSFGLVGKDAPHTLHFDAKDVEVDAQLAPLLARVSPLLATGEEGGVGGRISASGDLTSQGLKGKRIKRKLAGEGDLTLKSVQVASTSWFGQVLDLVGLGGPIAFGSTTIPWKVANGQVETGTIPIKTSGLALSLAGSATLDGELDYVLRVKPKERSESFDRLETLLDDQGFLPLRLEGDVSDPKLKLPSTSDLLGGSGDSLKDLWDKLRGKDDDKDKDPPKKKRPKKKRKKKPKDDAGAEEEEDEPPPPPPDDDPPPPPPDDDPPPPPR